MPDFNLTKRADRAVTREIRFAEDGTLEVQVDYWIRGPMAGHAFKETFFLQSGCKHVHIAYMPKGGGIVAGQMLAACILDGRKDVATWAVDP